MGVFIKPVKVLSISSRLGLLLAIAFIFTGTSAFGQNFAQTDSFSGYNAQSVTADDLGFDTFNQEIVLGNIPVGATLTSVQLELLNVTGAASGTVTNNSSSTAVNVTYNLSGNNFLSTTYNGSQFPPGNDLVDLTFNAGTIGVGTGSSGSTGGSLAPNQTVNIPTTGTIALSTTNTSTTILNNGSDPSDIAYFTSNGGGANLTVFLTGNLSIGANGTIEGPGGQLSSTGVETSDGMAEIIYNYTTVPEPRETAAWMLAFAACLLVGRKFLRRPLAVQQPA